MHKVFLALLLFLSLGMGASSQGKSGTLSATVLDQHKAVLRGASVTLTNVDTKAVQKCVSSEKRECRFEVVPGAYELQTELLMFCPLKVSDIRLKENETVPVELKLAPVVWKDYGPEYEKLLKTRGL